MTRQLKPELLDSLRPDDPSALQNRRDLRLINFAMGNPRWFARSLRRLLRPGDRILEIGAGTGDLSRHLASHGLSSDGLDLWPEPAGWPSDRAWHQADLREFDGFGRYDVILANLILHQFSPADLAELGRRWAGRVRLLLACEPARRRRALVLFQALGAAIRANFVTWHDAPASIEAGFIGRELPENLGLDAGRWRIRTGETLRGAYRMIAERR